MTQAIPKNSVWSAMNYPPPRGRCNYKTSLMSPACPCLRFMLHPVKAATSFECDGCQHHASFHSLENPTEDAIVARWEAQEAANRVERQAIAGANKKRKRIAERPENSMPGVFEIIDTTQEIDGEDGVDTETENVLSSEGGSTVVTTKRTGAAGTGVKKTTTTMRSVKGKKT